MIETKAVSLTFWNGILMARMETAGPRTIGSSRRLPSPIKTKLASAARGAHTRHITAPSATSTAPVRRTREASPASVICVAPLFKPG